MGTTSPGATLDVENSSNHINVQGITSNTSGIGVLGMAKATTGLTVGVEGINSSSTGFGVAGLASGTSGTGMKGVATATSGTTFGVIGVSASTGGVAVFGNATATSGSTIGVKGHASSPSGIAVFGNATATSGNAIGVQGSTASPTGVGVAGNGGAASGTGIVGVGGSNAVDGGTAGLGGQFSGGTETGTGGFGGNGLVVTGGGGGGTFGGGVGIKVSGGTPSGLLDGEVGGDGLDSAGGSAATFNSVGGLGVSAIGGNGTGGGSGGAGVVAQGGSGTFGGDGIDASGGSGGPGRSGLAGSFTGDVSISGNLTVSGTKHFKIDHPLDPANKYLYHAAVESSEVLNLYTGNATLDEQGEAVVQLPDWFEALNKDFRYQLTPIGGAAPNLHIAQKIQDKTFRIAGGGPGLEVSWQLTAVRQDAWEKAHPMMVEVAKPARERGYYLNPELFGAPEEKGIEWARHPETMRRLREIKGRKAGLARSIKH